MKPKWDIYLMDTQHHRVVNVEAGVVCANAAAAFEFGRGRFYDQLRASKAVSVVLRKVSGGDEEEVPA